MIVKAYIPAVRLHEFGFVKTVDDQDAGERFWQYRARVGYFRRGSVVFKVTVLDYARGSREWARITFKTYLRESPAIGLSQSASSLFEQNITRVLRYLKPVIGTVYFSPDFGHDWKADEQYVYLEREAAKGTGQHAINQ